MFCRHCQNQQKCDSGGLCTSAVSRQSGFSCLPLTCIFFISPKSPLCLTVLCKMPKPCKYETLSFHRLASLAQSFICSHGLRNGSNLREYLLGGMLLYPSRKSAEIAQICCRPISVYRHPARKLPSPVFLPSPASISIVKGVSEFRVPVGSRISTRSKAPFLLSPDSP